MIVDFRLSISDLLYAQAGKNPKSTI